VGDVYRREPNSKPKDFPMIVSLSKRDAVMAALISILVSVPAFAHDSASHVHQVATRVAGHEAPFLAENDAAMEKMMSAMAVKPTGDIERDFVEMMIPHHQGALDMAQAYLRYGKNEQLKRIAQEIIVEQLQEIAAMRIAVGDPIPLSAPVPTQVGVSLQASTAAHHKQ